MEVKKVSGLGSVFLSLMLVGIASSSFANETEKVTQTVRSSTSVPSRFNIETLFECTAGESVRLQGSIINAGSVNFEAPAITIAGRYDETEISEEDTLVQSKREFIPAEITSRDAPIRFIADEVTLEAPQLNANETIVSARKLRLALGQTHMFHLSRGIGCKATQAKITGKLKFEGETLEIEVFGDRPTSNFLERVEFDESKVNVVYVDVTDQWFAEE